MSRAAPPPPPPRPRPTRFGLLARLHATTAAGDAALAVALADSVLFSIDPDAARNQVLLFLGVSFVPFLFVAPLIGPAIDRIAGGRRMVIQLVCVGRIVLSILMAFHATNIALFPLAFAALVLQKTYSICKSALVPTVVRSEEELVEANSKLGLISGMVGFVALLFAGALQKTIGTKGSMFFSALIFLFALYFATRLPRDVVAAKRADRAEQEELHAAGVVLATTSMLLIRATVGFTFFHLFFWFRDLDAGLVWFGLSLALASVLTMFGNAIAPWLRHRASETTMLIGSLVLIGVAGVGAAALGGVAAGVLLAGAVNLAAAIGRLAVDSIVQRDAPGANRGRAFAQFETRFQLGWVLAGLIPVLIVVPGQVGFLIVAIIAIVGAVLFLLGSRSVARGGHPYGLRGKPRQASRSAKGRPPTATRAPVRRARAEPAKDQERRVQPASEVRRRP